MTTEEAGPWLAGIPFSELRRNRLRHPDIDYGERKIFEYLEQLASQTSTNIDAWEMEAFKGIGVDPLDKRAINRTFFARKEGGLSGVQKLDVLAEEQLAAAQVRIQEITEERITELKNERNRFKRGARDAYHVFEAKIEGAWKHSKEIMALENRSASYIRDEIAELLREGFWEFKEYSNSRIQFITKQDVVMHESNPSAGINRTINLGKYKVSLKVPSMSLRVNRFSANRIANGHWHPYVDTDGDICWGNAASSARDMLSDGKVLPAMQLLSSLLVTYSTDSRPWQELRNFEGKRTYDEDDDIEDSDGEDEPEICDVCDEDLDDCNCIRCDYCDWQSLDSSCEFHYCGICNGNRENCGCCQECEQESGNCERCRECDEHDGHGNECANAPSDEISF